MARATNAGDTNGVRDLLVHDPTLSSAPVAVAFDIRRRGCARSHGARRDLLLQPIAEAAPGLLQVKLDLQAQEQALGQAEAAAQAEIGVGGDGAAAVDQLVDPAPALVLVTSPSATPWVANVLKSRAP